MDESPLNGHSYSGSALFTILLFPILTALLLWPLSTLADTVSGYWTMEAFMEKHPEQKDKNAFFSKRVESPAIPLPESFHIPEPVRIGIIYPGFETSDYWTRNIKAFTLRMHEHKIPYILHVRLRYDNKPYVSHEDMHLIRDMLQMNPDYLICTLPSPEHNKIIERILSRPKPKIILQNITTPIKRWDISPPLLYVGFDHVEGTRMLAEHGRKTPGSYVVLNPDHGYLSKLRGDTYINFNAAHGLKPKDIFFTGINRKKARLATLEAIDRHPDLTRIYATTTDIALGAADALKEMGIEKQIHLNGWGGGQAELDALEKGELDVTLMRINDDSGVAMADAIALDIQGQGHYIPRIYSGRMQLVDTDMSRVTLNEISRQAFRYSGLQGELP
ncbi:substrate-binding domain-containing protein [Desulfobotulus mexicanus]|uniref:Substrate-binding domain-containing protein n=1 Tax=Desulfobotulus mexicanus TaxID=2586642 RepID=A0A5S5MEW5_9BACT|nr:substrate-binding domain-containing protein [Desulfobotulus mexicanus]TYT74271.1 substrate-binding domain-containing protein [Desulfobotulus mexicanus]